jgi:predicted PhzF superfamily epimerase YddE/YHI9
VNYEIVQVDAFTSRALEGNACAVLPDARGLDDTMLQRIARENNLSETAYVFPGERSDFRVRYFTPYSEIPISRHFADFAGGIVEDPFTGSASGGMAAYCAHYGLIKDSSYSIAQGDHVGRRGRGWVRVIGEASAIEGVEIGGEAVTVLRGTLIL